jgi:hypothetical protein
MEIIMIIECTKVQPKLIQSYVKELFFVSTIYRQSSAIVHDMWYYETIAFTWDKETRQSRNIVCMEESTFADSAIKDHFNICMKLATLSSNDESDAIDKLFAEEE